MHRLISDRGTYRAVFLAGLFLLVPGIPVESQGVTDESEAVLQKTKGVLQGHHPPEQSVRILRKVYNTITLRFLDFEKSDQPFYQRERAREMLRDKMGRADARKLLSRFTNIAGSKYRDTEVRQLALFVLGDIGVLSETDPSGELFQLLDHADEALRLSALGTLAKNELLTDQQLSDMTSLFHAKGHVTMADFNVVEAMAYHDMIPERASDQKLLKMLRMSFSGEPQGIYYGQKYRFLRYLSSCSSGQTYLLSLLDTNPEAIDVHLADVIRHLGDKIRKEDELRDRFSTIVRDIAGERKDDKGVYRQYAWRVLIERSWEEQKPEIQTLLRSGTAWKRKLGVKLIQYLQNADQFSGDYQHLLNDASNALKREIYVSIMTTSLHKQAIRNEGEIADLLRSGISDPSKPVRRMALTTLSTLVQKDQIDGERFLSELAEILKRDRSTREQLIAVVIVWYTSDRSFDVPEERLGSASPKLSGEELDRIKNDALEWIDDNQ